MAFHPSARFVYANSEMTCAVTGFRYDAGRGLLSPIETLSTLPDGVAVNPLFSTAESEVHPNGRFLYVSNRGHNTIAVFAIDDETGKLRLIENTPSEVKTPRGFGIDPSGRWLIAGGQDSNTVVVFSINPSTGRLTPTSAKLLLGSPVCVRFLKRS